MWEKIKEEVDANRENILQNFNDLHDIPEVSFHEHKTSSYIKNQIERYADKIEEIHDTGFVAEFDTNNPGPKIGLKVDMDALPFVDENGNNYSLHACGHDAHCTIGMWVLKLLKKLRLSEKGAVRVIFQPGEEKLTGASVMAEKGAVKELDKLYGLHLRPKSELKLYQAAPALLHSGSVRMKVAFYGQASHSSKPHLGINSIDAAIMAVNGLKFIEWNPLPHSSIAVTQISSDGEADNVIPPQTNITIDIRADHNEELQKLRNRVEQVCANGASSVNARWEVKSETKVPASEYDDDSVNHLASCIEKLLGDKAVNPFKTTGSDDFHMYKSYSNNLKTAFLALGAELEPGLHSPDMSFDTEAIMIGIKILTGTIAEQLQ